MQSKDPETLDRDSTFSRSHEIFEAAQKVIPGGVNSPVRAYKSVGGEPVVLARGLGSRVWDVDGNEFIDYIGSWGPLILGHAPADVVEAVCAAAASGTSFGALTQREVEFAEILCAAVPCLEMVRLVNSGTEAVMSAIRLARAATGRDLVIKFEGGYHGHSDGLLAKAGSGIATQGIPGTPGVPEGFAALTLTIPFNDRRRSSRGSCLEGRRGRLPDRRTCAGEYGRCAPAAGLLDRGSAVARRRRGASDL